MIHKTKNLNKYKHRSKKNKNLFFILFICLLSGIVYILFFSSVFKIKEVVISGNEKVSVEEIQNNLIYKNIILITSRGVKNQLFQKIPAILDLKIRKNILKRRLEISIQEREDVGIVCGRNPTFAKASVGTCFYFDKDGIVFMEAPNSSGSLVTIIQDYSNRNYELGNQISEKNFIDIILEINEILFSEIGLKILSFNIDSYPIEELKAVTNEGWYILFNLERDTKNQLLILKVGLNEKIKNRADLQYVDLRIENRIYYK
jgi:hypothetical protein